MRKNVKNINMVICNLVTLITHSFYPIHRIDYNVLIIFVV